MPAVRSQSVDVISADHATVTLVTQQFGTIFVDVLRTNGPTVVTITSVQDGVQRGQTVLSNPPAATVESNVDAAVAALLPGGLQFRSHLLSVSPLALQIACFDAGVVIPAAWWT
jgi:hypothetical protein